MKDLALSNDLELRQRRRVCSLSFLSGHFIYRQPETLRKSLSETATGEVRDHDATPLDLERSGQEIRKHVSRHLHQVAGAHQSRNRSTS